MVTTTCTKNTKVHAVTVQCDIECSFNVIFLMYENCRVSRRNTIGIKYSGKLLLKSETQLGVLFIG